MFQHSSLSHINRAKWLRLFPLERHHVRHLLTVSAMIAGAVFLLGACLYRRVWHPEWTGGQALAGLWPFYLVAALSIYFGWRFHQSGTTDHAGVVTKQLAGHEESKS
jgi:hypothetical protein